MSTVENAVSWAESIAADDRYGYDQGQRDTVEFDCSSLVCRALRAAGFDAPMPSFSTRTMGGWLTANGWVWHHGTADVQRGDIMWKTGHTAFATSSTQIVEACIDEHGDISGGADGDQTGNEIRITNMSRYAWEGYYRYVEDEMTKDDMETLANMTAEKIMNYMLNGTMFRDRIIGTDNAANGANNKLANTNDVTGRTSGITPLDHIRYIAQAVAENRERLEAIENNLAI